MAHLTAQIINIAYGARHYIKPAYTGINTSFLNKEDATMKMSVYTATKTIYGNKERLNMEPVAFDYVPNKKRGLRNGSR